ncbi:unnamed protein product [Closterium sp. Naga37s-1]|nr:unnamed protein product [Closterium sp. Naga37s-1]
MQVVTRSLLTAPFKISQKLLQPVSLSSLTPPHAFSRDSVVSFQLSSAPPNLSVPQSLPSLRTLAPSPRSVHLLPPLAPFARSFPALPSAAAAPLVAITAALHTYPCQGLWRFHLCTRSNYNPSVRFNGNVILMGAFRFD